MLLIKCIYIIIKAIKKYYIKLFKRTIFFKCLNIYYKK